MCQYTYLYVDSKVNSKYIFMKTLFALIAILLCYSYVLSQSDSLLRYKDSIVSNPTQANINPDSVKTKVRADKDLEPKTTPVEKDIWTSFDKALEPVMAATLAGLSLAAFALFLSLLVKSREEHNALKNDYLSIKNEINKKDLDNKSVVDLSGELEVMEPIMEKKEKEYNNLARGVKDIKRSFYWFIGFLFETLSIDILQEKYSFFFMELDSQLTTQIVEVCISGGLIGVGIFFLIRGTINMKTVVYS